MDLAAMEAAMQQMQDEQVQLQQQLAATQAEATQSRQNQAEMVDRIKTTDATLVALRAANDTLVNERRESMAVLGGIPAALARLGAAKEKPRMLMDSRGLGKPSILNSVETEDDFRKWAIKVEDYVSSQFGEKFREVMQWVAEYEDDINEWNIDQSYGKTADLADHIDDLKGKNNELYSALRYFTDGTPSEYVDNSPKGNGLEAWRVLHRQ